MRAIFMPGRWNRRPRCAQASSRRTTSTILAEKIDSMGRTEKRELVSRLTILLLHLLKWRFLRGRSWRLSVEGQRLDVDARLADNPSLRAGLDAAVARAYRRALIDAERETGLDAATFPAACPWSFDQITDAAFWPESNE
jgi:hypothetical protein